jgi:hypothetical protein
MEFIFSGMVKLIKIAKKLIFMNCQNMVIFIDFLSFVLENFVENKLLISFFILDLSFNQTIKHYYCSLNLIFQFSFNFFNFVIDGLSFVIFNFFLESYAFKLYY